MYCTSITEIFLLTTMKMNMKISIQNNIYFVHYCYDSFVLDDMEHSKL